MPAATREPCWPVWIWDESDWDHSAPYFGYIRYAEKDALEAVFRDLTNAGFAFSSQVGLYMQEESDERVPRPLARFVERALESYLRGSAHHRWGPSEPDLMRDRAEAAAVLARHKLRLNGWHVEQVR